MSTEDHPQTVQDEEGPSLSSEGERASLLASVLKHDADRKEAQAAVLARVSKPIAPQLITLALATVAAVYLWFGSPGWLTPLPVPVPGLAEEGTTVRLAVWLGVQQVEAFRERNGRVPGIQELGPLPPGIEYQRLDARSYLIAGIGERVGITYSSDDPPDDLLEAAEAILGSGAFR